MQLQITIRLRLFQIQYDYPVTGLEDCTSAGYEIFLSAAYHDNKSLAGLIGYALAYPLTVGLDGLLLK